MPNYRSLILTSLLLACSSALAAGDNVRKPTMPNHRELMLEQAFGLKLDAMNDAELAKSEAKYLRNLYQALIAEGFTEEEAFEIVVHHQSLLLSR